MKILHFYIKGIVIEKLNEYQAGKLLAIETLAGEEL
jgi:hypothetical protein